MIILRTSPQKYVIALKYLPVVVRNGEEINDTIKHLENNQAH